MQKYEENLYPPNIFSNFAAMNIEPVAFFQSPLKSKFGIPRQSGLVAELQGRLVFTPEYRHDEAVRGLNGFDYLWIIWEFSANKVGGHKSSLTVRPPRLGGNERVGVFASRSPFRPNSLGLSCVRIESVEMSAKEGPVICVRGADLMDGTPIYDIKPYVPYADAHPNARSGFVDECEWNPLEVIADGTMESLFTADEWKALKNVLAQDPRPRYHDDPLRVYGMPFANHDVKFRVVDGVVTIVEIL